MPARMLIYLLEFVFSTLEFPYPVFLTTWHLAFSVSSEGTRSDATQGRFESEELINGQAISTRVLQRTTTLLDGVKDVDMTVSVLPFPPHTSSVQPSVPSRTPSARP